jgi:hypothetical protein
MAPDPTLGVIMAAVAASVRTREADRVLVEAERTMWVMTIPATIVAQRSLGQRVL